MPREPEWSPASMRVESCGCAPPQGGVWDAKHEFCRLICGAGRLVLRCPPCVPLSELAGCCVRFWRLWP